MFPRTFLRRKTSGSSVLAEKDERLKEKDNVLKEKDNVLKEKDNVLKEKDERLKEILKEKDNVLEEKDERLKEKDNVLKSLELKILDVETKWMRELSRHEGVIANRQTVELICRQNYPKDPPTIASSKFCWETLIQESVDKKGNKGVTLKPRGLELLKELEPEQNEFIKQSVATELKDLYDELRKPLHFADPVEKGLHIAGPLPLRAAIALVVLQAQAKKNHPRGYFYTDEKGQTLKVLQMGMPLQLSQVGL